MGFHVEESPTQIVIREEASPAGKLVIAVGLFDVLLGGIFLAVQFFPDQPALLGFALIVSGLAALPLGVFLLLLAQREAAFHRVERTLRWTDRFARFSKNAQTFSLEECASIGLDRLQVEGAAEQAQGRASAPALFEVRLSLRDGQVLRIARTTQQAEAEGLLALLADRLDIRRDTSHDETEAPVLFRT